VACDQRLVDMDEEELVAIIEQPDGSMLDTPVCAARNGGAGPVRSNVQGSKSASAPDRAGKFKKQRPGSSPGRCMCGRTNGSSSADTGPAFVLALTMKTFPLTSTSVLAI
jgi:hypothetical protein